MLCVGEKEAACWAGLGEGGRTGTGQGGRGRHWQAALRAEGWHTPAGGPEGDGGEQVAGGVAPHGASFLPTFLACYASRAALLSVPFDSAPWRPIFPFSPQRNSAIAAVIRSPCVSRFGLWFAGIGRVTTRALTRCGSFRRSLACYHCRCVPAPLRRGVWRGVYPSSFRGLGQLRLRWN